jgi:hypothetical protein
VPEVSRYYSNAIRQFQAGESHTAVKLRICKQTHKMSAVAGLDVVALQMKRNIAECLRIAVNIKRTSCRTGILAVLLGLLDLTQEVLAEV